MSELNTHAVPPKPAEVMNMAITLPNLDLMIEGISELQIKRAGPLWLSLLQGRDQFVQAMRQKEVEAARQAQMAAENELEVDVEPAPAPAPIVDEVPAAEEPTV